MLAVRKLGGARAAFKGGQARKRRSAHAGERDAADAESPPRQRPERDLGFEDCVDRVKAIRVLADDDTVVAMRRLVADQHRIAFLPRFNGGNTLAHFSQIFVVFVDPIVESDAIGLRLYAASLASRPAWRGGDQS